MGKHDRASPTLEHGHRVLPQYLGIIATRSDPRPDPTVRRGVSAEDDPEKAIFVERLKAKYRKEED